MTILEYVKHRVRVPITDDSIRVLLLDRGIKDVNADAESFSAKQRDLVYADSLMHIASSLTSSGGRAFEHGGFMDRQASEVLQDRNSFVGMAMNIYREHGDERYDGSGSLTWEDND